VGQICLDGKRKEGEAYVPSVIAPMSITASITGLGNAQNVRKAFLRQVMDQVETSGRKLGGLERLLRKQGARSLQRQHGGKG